MADTHEKLKKLNNWIGQGIRSSRGRDVLVYLVFVCVAFVFWALLSLDNEVQRDFDVPVELQDVPDSITMVTPFPPTLSVSVKGKGSQLIRFLWSRSIPTLKLKFEEQKGRDNQYYIGRQRLESRLREYFGSGTQIVSCKPDSLKALYTSRPGHKLKLVIDADIHTNLQYIISGPIKASVDSVTVYSVNSIPKNLKQVMTEPIVRNGLRDTSRYEVRVRPIAGMRMIPDVVTVTVPVEPLIAKKKVVTIETINVPDGYNVILFPSKITVSYLVPISEYSHDIPISVYADYRMLENGGGKIPLSMSGGADVARNISLDTDSVEYIIDKSVR